MNDSTNNVDAQIREHRTANVTLTVFKEDQTPLVNQEVEVAQRSHKFLFGCIGFCVGTQSRRTGF